MKCLFILAFSITCCAAQDCPVCLAEISEATGTVRLCCGDVLCSSCFTTWQEVNVLCPVCTLLAVRHIETEVAPKN